MSRRHEDPASRVALDVGSVDGRDPWREVEGVAFVHWDRWLLRLALDEPEGLDSIRNELLRRARVPGRIDEVAEALLEQVVDLQARRARLRVATVLDAGEQSSTWLRDKAVRRVWQASSSLRCTPAMQRTPRAVLEERALHGNWNAFAVSPAPYAAELQSAVGEGYYDYRATGLVVTSLELVSIRLLSDAISDDARLAVHRAVLTVGVRAMEQVDDDWDLAEYVREHESAYLDLLRVNAAASELLPDYLELVVWEVYGLLTKTESFLGSLPESVAARVDDELVRIAAELQQAHCEHQHERASRLRTELLGGTIRA